MKAIFVSNWEGVEKTLGSDEAQEYMRGAMETVMAAVIQSVPVDTGSYLHGFQRTLAVDVQVDEHKGAIGLLGTSHGLYHIIEWGSRNNEAYHPFGKGVQRAGLKFVPTPKGD